MTKDLHEYRVKPTRGYGISRRVAIMAILDNSDGLRPKHGSYLRMDYDDAIVVCYNPQNLIFHLAYVVSALKTIHGEPNNMEIVKCQK